MPLHQILAEVSVKYNMSITSITKPGWFTDYTVQWRPTIMCNYDCSYCTPSNHKQINLELLPDVDRLNQAVDKIYRQTEGKKVMVVITGGEPFLIPNFHEFLGHMIANRLQVMVFTNGSMPIKVYEKCKHLYSNPNLLMRISYHPEKQELNKVVSLAKLIEDEGGDYEVRAMMVQGLFESSLQLKEYIPEDKILYLPVYPLYNKKEKIYNPVGKSSRHLKNYHQTLDNKEINYFSTEESEMLKKLKDININFRGDVFFKIEVEENGKKYITKASDIIRKGQNKFMGWSCDINRRKILIQENGDITSGVCNNDGLIGNIFEGDPKLFSDIPTICKQSRCTVIEEVMIDKFKNQS